MKFLLDGELQENLSPEEPRVDQSFASQLLALIPLASKGDTNFVWNCWFNANNLAYSR